MARYPETVFDDRLDRCKHCGSAAIVEGPEFHESFTGYVVTCDGNADCMIQTSECPTLEEAIAAWNRRPAPQPDKALVEEIEYRLVEEGETIEATDEFLEDDLKTWSQIGGEFTKWGVRMRWSEHGFIKPLRRPLPAPPEVK